MKICNFVNVHVSFQFSFHVVIFEKIKLRKNFFCSISHPQLSIQQHIICIHASVFVNFFNWVKWHWPEWFMMMMSTLACTTQGILRNLFAPFVGRISTRVWSNEEVLTCLCWLHEISYIFIYLLELFSCAKLNWSPINELN